MNNYLVKRVYSLAIIGALFVFITFPVQSQIKTGFEISGIVYDSITGNPLADANVFLSSNSGSITSYDGKFCIQQVLPGKYVLKVRFMGYCDYSMKIMVGEEDIKGLKIALLRSVIHMDELTVSADQMARVREKAYRINRVSAEQIETSALQDFTEVLDFVPGVNVNNTTGIFSSKTVVSMRGLSGNEQSRVLVILDGMPLNKTDEGSVNWNQINRDNIKEIMIHKGPGQAIYGSGAMGGVIEINTKEPKPGFHTNAHFSVGTYNTFKEGATLSGNYELKNGKSFWWSLNGTGTQSDGYITEDEQFYDIEDTILVPSFIKEYQLSGKMNYKAGKYDNFSIKLSYFDDKRGNGIKVFEHEGAFSEHDTYSSMVRYLRTRGNRQTDIRFYFLHETYTRLYEYMNEGEYSLYDVDSKRNDAGADLRLSFLNRGKHSLLAGFNLKNGSVDASDTYYTSTDIISNKGGMATGALYFQDDIKLSGDDLKLTLGLRYDAAAFYDAVFRVDYPSYSIEFMDVFEDTLAGNELWSALCPNISMQYKFSAQSRLFFTMGRGFRAPTLDDLTRTGKKRGTFKVANPLLKPELLDNIELGYDYDIFPDLHTGISAYYSIGHDFMYYISTGDSVNMVYKTVPIIRKENISKVVIAGVEMNIEYELMDRIYAFLNYTFGYSIINDFEVKDTLVDVNLDGKHLTDVPNHKFTGGIVYKSHGFTASFNVKYTGKRWINDQNIVDDEYLFTDRYPAYTVYNFSIRKIIGHRFEIGFSVENLFNKVFIDNTLQRCPGRMVFGNLGYRF